MLALFSRIAAMLFIAIGIITAYYSGTLHSESWKGSLLVMLVILGCLYGGYKWMEDTELVKEKSYSLRLMAGVFLWEMFMLAFFMLGGGGFVLFFKAAFYLLLPIFIILLSGATGKQLLLWIDQEYNERSREFHIIAPTAVGLCVLLFGISIVTPLGGYTLSTIGTLLAGMIAIGWRQVFPVLRDVWNFRIEKSDFPVSFRNISSEGVFLFLGILFSVSFLSIVRPMPIGWDDLGVYMNYPRIIAETGHIGGLGMIAWQSLTAIGFLFKSATQAFFLNQIGGILSVVFLFFTISGLMKKVSEGKKHYISLPLLSATLFYAMPMVIFEQAKDMKLDPGLFCLSIAAIFIAFEVLWNHKNIQNRSWITLWGIIGCVVGIAFAVKVTTLLLILGISASILYITTGPLGLIGFVSLVTSVFTKFGIWTSMNISYPKENLTLLSYFTIATAVIGVIGLIGGWYLSRRESDRDILSWKKALIALVAFSVTTGLAITPWIVKNVAEFGSPSEIHSSFDILNGKMTSSGINAASVRSPEDIAIINERNRDAAMSNSGTTTNEDWGRYFGYETGINNYLKLPFNLTFQKNQAGEYTEITFIYLALVPIVFLFLSYTTIAGVIGALGVILLGFLYYVIPGTSTALTTFFSGIGLPLGYAVITALFLIPPVFLHYTLEKTETNRLFMIAWSFLAIYCLFFVVSAYGVVWYGIAMYGVFLLVITLGFEKILRIPEDAEDLIPLSASMVLFFVFAAYFVFSSLPHAWNNLFVSGFAEFKSWEVTQEEGIFESHSEYLPILATLNLKDPSAVATSMVASVQNPILQKIITSQLGKTPGLSELAELLIQVESISWPADTDQATINTILQEAREVRGNIYNKVLYPVESERNKAAIYRIGTFLTYFISENRARYYEDSLVQNFNDYFYDENPDVTVERIKKAGLKYFLVDLNAATIDRDPRHNLTTRFENLLKTLGSDKLKLIKTDSLCLETAVYEAKNKRVNSKEYLLLGGVNSESYQKTTDGQDGVIPRGTKLQICQKYIASVIKEWKVANGEYSFLTPIANYVAKQGLKTDAEIMNVVSRATSHGWLALFEVQ